MSESSSTQSLIQPVTDHAETLEARVSRTERDIASLAATVKTLAHTVETSHQEQREGFRQVYTKLDNLTDKQASQGKMSWPLLIGACMLTLSLVAAIGTFIVLHTGPIKESQREDHEILMTRISQLPADYEEFGYQRAKIEALERDSILEEARVNKIESQANSNTTALDYMREWVKATDEKGSRVHNVSTPKLLEQLQNPPK